MQPSKQSVTGSGSVPSDMGNSNQIKIEHDKKFKASKGRWTSLKAFTQGHKFWRDNVTGLTAISDQSNAPDNARFAYPHQTDDGILWVDTNATITARGDSYVYDLPLFAPDGSRTTTPAIKAEALWCAENLGMAIKGGPEVLKDARFLPPVVRTVPADRPTAIKTNQPVKHTTYVVEVTKRGTAQQFAHTFMDDDCSSYDSPEAYFYEIHKLFFAPDTTWMIVDEVESE